MSSRQTTQTTNTKTATPDVSTPASESMFQSRPFVVQSQSAETSQQPDLKASLKMTQRYGHHLQMMETEQPMETNREQESPMLQTKLTMGTPGDMYEREADTVATAVVDRIHGNGEQTRSQSNKNKPSQPLGLNIQPLVQPLVQNKPSGDTQQNKPNIEQSIEQQRGRGEPLSYTIREPMEQAFGADFSGVKIHNNTQSDQINRSIQARAFTTGQDVFFRQAEYDHSSKQGQQLLAHELTHVVQQNGGAVQGMQSRTFQAGERFGTSLGGKVKGAFGGKVDTPAVSHPNVDMPSVKNTETGVKPSQTDVNAPKTDAKAPEIGMPNGTGSQIDTPSGVRTEAGTSIPRGSETTAAGRSTHTDQPEIEPGVVAKEATHDGHEIKVIKDGRVARCSNCAEIRQQYAAQLEENPSLNQRLNDIEKIQDPKEKAREAKQLEQELSRARELKELGDRDLVTNFRNSEQRQMLEAHIQEPKKTSNMRDALKLAKEESARREPEAREKVIQRLQSEVGIDITKHPDAYERIVEHVKKSDLTINFSTVFLENMLKSGYYMNQWEKSVHPNSGKKAYYGDSSYAESRNQTEKTLHNLPEMLPISEAAQAIPNIDSKVMGAQDKHSLPIDRPRAAAVNVANHRAGGAVNVSYGTSHFVLNENVKADSTLTGGDSLEAISKKGLGPEAVGTFENLGTVLLHMNPTTLKAIANQALNPDAARNTMRGLNSSLAYVEAQVFRQIKLSRDVSKIVIDEKDLDAWQAGQLMNPTKPGTKLEKRQKSEIKQMLEDYAQKHGIALQYICTGRSNQSHPTGAGVIRNPGEQISAFKQPWENKVEEALNLLKNKEWEAGLTATMSLGGTPNQLDINTSKLSEIGFDQLAQILKQSENFYKNRNQYKLEDQKIMVSTFAENIQKYYFAKGVDREHMDIIKQAMVKAASNLGVVATDIVSKGQNQ